MPLDADSFDPLPLLEVLVDEEVDFVVIGGVAGGAQGSSYPTYDLDVAYARDRRNLERLASALRRLDATLRGAPPDVPFPLDAETLEKGSHFTFSTSHGPLDIPSDPDGAPPYPELKARAFRERVRGRAVAFASLDHLIAMKEASGRVKDKLMASDYRVLADRLRAPREES